MAKQILFGMVPGLDGPSGSAGVIARAKGFIDERPWISRCVLHLAGADIPASALVGRAAPADANTVLEIWCEGDFGVASGEAPFTCSAAYQVEEVIEKGDPRFAPGVLPGLTLISRVFPKAGFSAAEFRASYDLHPPLARKVHIGMETYVRNFVSSIAPEDALAIGAIACLHFPTDEDFIERLYTGQEGRAAIAADAARFMDRDRSASMVARSIVLR